MLFLILIMMTVTIVYWYVNGNKLRLPGDWYREIDVTSQVKESITDYLNEAMLGNEINVDDYVDSIKIKSNLIIRKDGFISEHIDNSSYYEASKQANEALNKAVADLIKLRIEKNYIETDESIDELIDETFGMKLTDYLKEYGPKLINGYETMDSEYGMDGTYQIDKDQMVISTYEGDVDCEYAVASRMLVLDYVNGSVVYHHSGKTEEKAEVDNEEE